MLSTYEKVARLVKFATGEEYGDGEMVTAVLPNGYAEPGYGSYLRDETVVVLGNWNPKRWPRDGEPPLTPAESLPDRLGAALERVGADIEWLDEWDECRECHRAVRTQADSYSWQQSFIETDDGRVCHECAIEAGEGYLTEYVNDPRKCVTWCETSHIEQYGYAKWAPGDPQDYEHGWHPGQTDNPQAIHDSILEAHPDAEVLFFLDESSQFSIRFSAYVRLPE